MTKVVFEKRGGRYTGFEASGHALYASKGNDIVCASISILLFNTVNAITEINREEYELASDKEEGILIFRVLSEKEESTETLFEALVMGLKGIRAEYGKKYLKIDEKEVTKC
jgi:hypothetical protein